MSLYKLMIEGEGALGPYSVDKDTHRLQNALSEPWLFWCGETTQADIPKEWHQKFR